MCGFAGCTYADLNRIKSMAHTLEDRAIDDKYFHVESGFSLYHAHLKISDLDKNTVQPYSKQGITISLVGELYNKKFLLQKSGITQGFDTFTELETLYLLYKTFGAEGISYINGEFSVVIFDSIRQKYYLFRDRWGVNNLYYRKYNGQYYFASEIKALIFEAPKISRKAYIEHLTFQFSISPNTIVQNVFTIEPGSYIEISQNTVIHHSFNAYQYQENNIGIIETIESSIIRRIPQYQKKIFVSLSGGPDSNLILYFLNKHFCGEVIAYSFRSEESSPEIDIAIHNCNILGIRHCIIDDYMYENNLNNNSIYHHEGLVELPNLGKILRDMFPEHNDIKVEFGGDGKEELILGNNHYPYMDILKRYTFFQKKGLIQEYNISQEFLNFRMFDYNLQMIDKITLRNGLERRLPFTDYELLKYFKYPTYRKEAEEFLQLQGLRVVKGEFGYNVSFNFQYHYDAKIDEAIRNLFSSFSIIHV